jgi:predicted CXXCH cytochrome family protein
MVSYRNKKLHSLRSIVKGSRHTREGDANMALKIASVFLGILCFGTAAWAEEQKTACLECHVSIDRGKSIHPALAMGCESCHSAIDSSSAPHKKTNTNAKGLSADPPELCYGCHDKAPFTREVVHPALTIGCTACHTTHASDNAPLLLQPVEKLCTMCHDSIDGKHVMAGLGLGDDHPMKGKTDPARPARELSCISCHNPHSASVGKLFVNGATSVNILCAMCHRKISAARAAL